MTCHSITIEIDEAKLAGYTDEYLAVCWHVAQQNPAPYGDYQAGDLAERIGREIIRRWVAGITPELWHHQGRDHTWKELARLAVYEPGGPASDPRAFHAGRWFARPSAGDATPAADGEARP
jgi:hypothetical protein